MPRGEYARRVSGDKWEPEHDAKLAELVGGRLSYAQITPMMNDAFPGKHWTRNAMVGRAHRLHLISKRKTGGQTGAIKPRRVKNIEGYQRKAFVKKALAPVVFKKAESTLRDEADRGTHAEPKARKLNVFDPAVIERRKGSLPAVIEEKPLTSVSVADCESESCMWPTSEDITCLEVCGARAEVGAYCARHAAVAYRVMPTARRNGIHGKQDLEHTRRIDGSQHRDALDPDGEWLGRMIMEQVVSADGPILEIPHFLPVTNLVVVDD